MVPSGANHGAGADLTGRKSVTESQRGGADVMADYPDYTELFHLVGSDIMIPVDIQAQYVTLDIDIVAQTLGNIDIDIAAQSVGDITMVIASCDVTLDVDITAQTVGDITITIDAQTVAIYLAPDWNVKEGNVKTQHLFGQNLGEGVSVHYDYEVPAGKTLYITQASFAIYAYSVADADLNQIGAMSLMESDNFPIFLRLGGNGGGGAMLTAPAIFPAGTTARFEFSNRSNHHVDYSATFVGYEL